MEAKKRFFIDFKITKFSCSSNGLKYSIPGTKINSIKAVYAEKVSGGFDYFADADNDFIKIKGQGYYFKLKDSSGLFYVIIDQSKLDAPIELIVKLPYSIEIRTVDDERYKRLLVEVSYEVEEDKSLLDLVYDALDRSNYDTINATSLLQDRYLNSIVTEIDEASLHDSYSQVSVVKELKIFSKCVTIANAYTFNDSISKDLLLNIIETDINEHWYFSVCDLVRMIRRCSANSKKTMGTTSGTYNVVLMLTNIAFKIFMDVADDLASKKCLDTCDLPTCIESKIKKQDRRSKLLEPIAIAKIGENNACNNSDCKKTTLSTVIEDALKSSPQISSPIDKKCTLLPCITINLLTCRTDFILNEKQSEYFDNIGLDDRYNFLFKCIEAVNNLTIKNYKAVGLLKQAMNFAEIEEYPISTFINKVREEAKFSDTIGINDDHDSINAVHALLNMGVNAMMYLIDEGLKPNVGAIKWHTKPIESIEKDISRGIPIEVEPLPTVDTRSVAISNVVSDCTVSAYATQVLPATRYSYQPYLGDSKRITEEETKMEKTCSYDSEKYTSDNHMLYCIGLDILSNKLVVGSTNSNDETEYKRFDLKSGKLVNVLDKFVVKYAKFVKIIPVSIDSIVKGDIVLVSNTHCLAFVKEIREDKSLIAVNESATEIKIIPEYLMGTEFSMIKKVVNLMNPGKIDNASMLMLMNEEGEDTMDKKTILMMMAMQQNQNDNGVNNNMLPLLLMDDVKDDKALLFMMMNQQNGGNMNNMLPLLLMGDKSGDDMLKTMMAMNMMNQMNGGKKEDA